MSASDTTDSEFNRIVEHPHVLNPRLPRIDEDVLRSFTLEQRRAVIAMFEMYCGGKDALRWSMDQAEGRRKRTSARDEK